MPGQRRTLLMRVSISYGVFEKPAKTKYTLWLLSTTEKYTDTKFYIHKSRNQFCSSFVLGKTHSQSFPHTGLGCQQVYSTSCTRWLRNADREGFEPSHGNHPPTGFQDRTLQPDLGISPKNKWCLRPDLNRHGI